MHLLLCVLALALAGSDDRTNGKSQNRAASSEDDLGDVREIWPMRIREAMRLGLEHSAALRVTFADDRDDFVVPNCFGPTTEVEDIEKRPRHAFANRTSIVVEPANAYAQIPQVKSDVSAIIRSVQKAYGQLASAHAGHWAADKAVNRARELIEIEQAINDLFCREDLEGLAVTIRRLERFENALAARNADVNTVEWRLRMLLGIPESDKRRIIPVTPPIAAPYAFAWVGALDDVVTKQPDPLRRNAFCRVPRANVIDALRAFDESAPPRSMRLDDELSVVLWALARPSASRSDGIWRCGDPSTTLALYVLIRRAPQKPPDWFAEAVIEAQRTYRQYEKARQSRIATEVQMSAQRLNWGKGRISADHYLDAVEEFATATANEQRRLSAYESAVFAVNACEGTLLAEHNVIVSH